MYKNPDNFSALPAFLDPSESDIGERDVPSEGSDPIDLKEAVETLQSWERLFSQSIPTNSNREDFIAGVEASVLNFNTLADPENNPGDKLFSKKIRHVNRILQDLTQEGDTFDQVSNLLAGIDFKDGELTLKIRRLFTEHFSAK